MKNKILLGILIFLIIVTGIISFGRYQAKTAMLNFVKNQGIKKEDILIDDFRRNSKKGGYNYILVTKADPDIEYEYYCDYYHSGKKVFLALYQITEKNINERIWGGGMVSEERKKQLKFPPPPGSEY